MTHYFLCLDKDNKDGNGLAAIRKYASKRIAVDPEVVACITDAMSYFVVQNNKVYSISKIYIDTDKDEWTYICNELDVYAGDIYPIPEGKNGDGSDKTPEQLAEEGSGQSNVFDGDDPVDDEL